MSNGVRRKGTAGGLSDFNQTKPTIIGRDYTITLYVQSYTDTVEIVIDDTNVIGVIESLGSNTYKFTATATSHKFGVRTSDNSFSFRRFSVRKVTAGFIFNKFSNDTWQQYFLATGYFNGVARNTLTLTGTAETPLASSVSLTGIGTTGWGVSWNGLWYTRYATEGVASVTYAGLDPNGLTIRVVMPKISASSAFSMKDQQYNQESVDYTLFVFAISVQNYPRVLDLDLRGNTPPTSFGLTAKALIESQGGTVLLDAQSGTGFTFEDAVDTNLTFDTAQGTSIEDIYMSPTGHKFYTLNRNTATVFQYDLDTNHDISSAVYNSKLFSVSAEDNQPWSMTISDNGLNLYVSGEQNHIISQYLLDTAWEINTAVLIGSTNVWYVTPNWYIWSIDSMTFVDNGSTLIVQEATSDYIHITTLSTPWDITSASTAGLSINWFDNPHLNESASVTGFSMSPDQTKLFSIWTDGVISEWDMSAPLEQYTVNYAYSGIRLVTGTPIKHAMTFNGDGSQVYFITLGGVITQYALSIYTGGLLSKSTNLTGTADSPTNSSVTVIGSSWAMVWENQTLDNYTSGIGSHIYGLVPDGVSSLIGIDHMDAMTSLDMSGQGYSKISVSNVLDMCARSIESTSRSLDVTLTGNAYLTSDGYLDKAIIETGGGTVLVQEPPDVTYDLTYAIYANKLADATLQDTAPQDIAFSADGTKMYVAGNSFTTIFQYTLSPAWDVSSAVYANKSKPVATEDGTIVGVTFDTTGTIMYVNGWANDAIYQYLLSTAWDVSTATYDNKTVSLLGQDNSIANVQFSDTGHRMFLSGILSDTVYQWNLGTNWDVSSATYATLLKDVGTEIATMGGIAFSSDGLKMFGVDAVGEDIYQYTLGTAWQIDTASYDSILLNVTTQGTTPSRLALSTDGRILYVFDSSSDEVYQYNL